MAKPHSLEVAIGPVPAPQQRDALKLVLASYDPAHRDRLTSFMIDAAQRGEISLDGLLAAFRGDHRIGAVWGQLLPGNTAIVWPPQIVAGELHSLAFDLLAVLNQVLIEREVKLAQAILPSATDQQASTLELAGYSHLANLLYMVSFRESFPHQSPAAELHFEPFDDSETERLVRIIEQTYVDTHDCPALNGMLTTSDVIDGYRGTGVYAASRWFFVQHAGRDVGCLLLTDHPQDDQWELVYMGLVPAARGRQWGLQIARYGQWCAGQAKRPRLVLAVDAENAPAISLYTAVGFRACDCRSIFWKTF